MITFLSVMIALILIGGITYYSFHAVITRQQNVTLEQSVTQIESYLQSHMTNIQLHLVYLSNPTIYHSFARPDFQLLLDNMLSVHTDSVSAIYVLEDGKYVMSAPDAMHFYIDGPVLTNVFNQATKWGFWWSEPYDSKFSGRTITVAKSIKPSEGRPAGAVALDLNLDKLLSELPGVSGRGGGIYLFARNGELISRNTPGPFASQPANGASIEDGLRKLVKSTEKMTTLSVPQGRYTVLRSENNRWDWVVFAVIEEAKAYSILHVVRETFLLLTGLWIAVSLIVANRLAAYIRKPIMQIATQMNKGAMGQLDTRIHLERSDEFNRISISFNKMMTHIQSLFHDLKTMEEQKRYHELKVLQSQINPHFLYNTLNSIYCLLETDRVHLIGPIMQSLVQILRYSIDKIEQLVHLRQEANHLERYIDLMKVRYGDVFDFDIVIDDALQSVFLPKLTLITLVENSIYYGLNQPSIRNHIIVLARRNAANEVVIEVSDTGPGMSPDKIASLLSSETTPQASSSAQKGLNNLGIRNINERIQLHFGKAYGLQIESVPGQGTTVNIRLPYKSA